ncbi:MAG: hopanoid biosynthesis-associated protein HpnK [Elusimicrobia bacterium]|nr:hopanoid biosynthesis-associated protein HpnK [Elusimicrobiota bacterium]
MKTLIVTADDFGLSPAVNEAVARGYREGVLRHASLMVAEDSAREAAALAKDSCRGLKLGLHLVSCAGKSVLGASKLGRLVGPDGRFDPDPVACGLRYFFDRDLAGPLEAELRAQFERYLSFGLAPGHVDGHVNVHVHPVVFPMAVRLAKEYGFGRVRLPGGELPASLSYSSRRWPKQLVEGTVFALLRSYLRRTCADGRVEVADRTFGLLRSGLMGEEYVLHALERLPEGVSELYFHPSADPASAAVDEPRPGHHSISDLTALVSPRVRRSIERLRIDLA